MLQVKEFQHLKQLILLSNFLLVACVTATHSPINSYKEGTFSGKIKITNLQDQKSSIFNVDIFAKKPSSLRLEVITPIGFHLASLTLQEDQATLIVPSKKIYRQGTSHSQIFKDVILLEIDLQWIIPILFEQPQSDWDCVSDQAGDLKTCQVDHFTIRWTKRMGHQKILNISSDRIEIIIYLKTFKPYLPSDPKLFILPRLF